MKWDDWRPQNPGLKQAFDDWREGKWVAALELFEHAVAEDSLQPDAWRGMGSVLWTLDRFEQASSAFRHAVELEPWNPMHWHNLGLAYRHLEKPAEARHLLEVATALDPEYEPAFNELANIHVEEGNFREALRIYDHALALDNSRAVVHHNRGVCLRLLGDFKGAAASFLAALKREPHYHHTLMELQGDWAAPFTPSEKPQPRRSRKKPRKTG
jgi:Tfp pilus assembly protein PilF